MIYLLSGKAQKIVPLPLVLTSMLMIWMYNLMCTWTSLLLRLESTLNCKSTAGNSTLHATSFHPHHLIKSIPYGEFLRLCRICSTEQEFHSCVEEAKLRFSERDYDGHTLQQALVKASRITLDSMLFNQGKVIGNLKPETSLITTYSWQQRQIMSIINNRWPIVLTDMILGDRLPTKPTLLDWPNPRTVR